MAISISNGISTSNIGAASIGALGLQGNLVGEAPEFSGLTLWLDADDSSTITKDVSDNVSAWDDKSNQSNDFTQSTGSFQPLWVDNSQNNRAGIQFDGLQEYLRRISLSFNAFQNTNDYIIFVVVNVTKADQNSIIATDSTGANTGTFLAHRSGPRLRFVHREPPATSGGDEVFPAAGPPPPSSTTYLGRAVRDGGSSMELFVDGSSIGSAGSTESAQTSALNCVIGRLASGLNMRHFGGTMYEILVYNRLLTSTEVNAVENYLNTKWDI